MFWSGWWSRSENHINSERNKGGIKLHRVLVWQESKSFCSHTRQVFRRCTNQGKVGRDGGMEGDRQNELFFLSSACVDSLFPSQGTEKQGHLQQRETMSHYLMWDTFNVLQACLLHVLSSLKTELD